MSTCIIIIFISTHILIHIQVQNDEYTPFHTHCPRPRHIAGVDALRCTHTDAHDAQYWYRDNRMHDGTDMP